MSPVPLKPLTRAHRKYTFVFLVLLFVCALPFLYLYATGYRLDWGGDHNFISTGGIFISAERTGAEIYIDDELVRETRVFRRAFYAQNLDPGTHRVHVQREGAHTWVKELPVYPHLVTEAEAFNLPMVPEARLITRFETTSGAPVIFPADTLRASTTQLYVRASTSATTGLVQNAEFVSRTALFAPAKPVRDPRAATSTPVSSPTSPKEFGGVRLALEGGEVFASWVGARESMPYYYCAESYPLLGTTTADTRIYKQEAGVLYAAEEDMADIEEKIQKVTPSQECKPRIRVDSKGQLVRAFDFFPGSTDLVLMLLDDGVYVVEIDDRGWQNMQPLMKGEKLDMRLEGGRLYISDGRLIYDIILE